MPEVPRTGSSLFSRPATLSCQENFVEDERRLRSGLPSVRVAILSDRALSYGAGVREDAPYLARARTAGIPVVRRGSGGTGVLHLPGDLVWSIVLPRADPRVGRGFVRAYSQLGGGVVEFLRLRHLEATWTPPPHLVPDYCVLSGRGEVLSVGPRVLGGAAQHLTQTALLHQGMIHRDVDGSTIARLFGVSDPAVMGRLACLADLGVDGGPGELADELAAAIRAGLGRSAG